MVLTRYWQLAAVAMVALLTAMVVTTAPGWLGLGAIALFVAGWLLLGRRAGDGNGPAVVLTAITALSALAGTAAMPNFAIFQFLAFPLAWTLAENTRKAIIANVAVALAVGVGFVIHRGVTLQNLLEIGLTVAISLGFSLALGLWITQIATASAQRQALIDELEAAQQQLATVSRDAGTIAERERIARDIHDTIAQDLTGLIMLAQRARRETDDTARDALIAQLEDGARAALAETRALIAAGSPAALDGGLPSALERLATRFTRETGIAVSVECRGDALHRDAEVVALRCTQEALANVRKHSGAHSVTVRLDGTNLTVSDDGAGFDPNLPAEGYGLSGMRDRLALAEGSLDVTSGATGTTLTIVLAPQTVGAAS